MTQLAQEDPSLQASGKKKFLCLTENTQDVAVRILLPRQRTGVREYYLPHEVNDTDEGHDVLKHYFAACGRQTGQSWVYGTSKDDDEAENDQERQRD